MPLFILGIFAFNFSMPITLYFANILLKGSEGFAFGTLAAALIPGYFIAMSFTYSIAVRICTVALCILSMVVMIIVSKRIKYDAGSADINHNPWMLGSFRFKGEWKILLFLLDSCNFIYQSFSQSLSFSCFCGNKCRILVFCFCCWADSIPGWVYFVSCLYRWFEKEY